MQGDGCLMRGDEGALFRNGAVEGYFLSLLKF